MPLRGTFLSATEINRDIVIFIKAGCRGRHPLQGKVYETAFRKKSPNFEFRNPDYPNISSISFSVYVFIFSKSIAEI